MAKPAFDVSLEIINWDEELARVSQEVEKFSSDDIAQRVIYATDTLRQVTPVRTGRARASWKHRITIRNGELQDAEISSDVPYMQKLNEGSSRQAPAFFIEQVLITIGVITE